MLNGKLILLLSWDKAERALVYLFRASKLQTRTTTQRNFGCRDHMQTGAGAVGRL